MKKVYDVIVMGAGSGGLVSACKLAKKGKSVLLIDKNNYPGGSSTSFVRGRFEFDTSLSGIFDYTTQEEAGSMYSLFSELNIQQDISFVEPEDAFHVVSTEKQEQQQEYTFPFGIDNFITKMEEYVPGSNSSLADFFELAKECVDAMDYIYRTDVVDQMVLKNNYSNFMRVSTYPLKTVLQSLDMPLKTQQILDSYWIYLSSPSKDMNFVHYAIFLYKYISMKVKIPVGNSMSIGLSLENQFRKLGGEIRYNTEVTKILIENNAVTGVKLDNGDSILANNVICDSNPSLVYKSLIEKEKIPKSALKLASQRVFGPKPFTIYLGLNKTPEYIGIKNYETVLYHSLDSNMEYERMKTLRHTNMILRCPNIVLPNCSPKGTTILTLHAFYFGDCFDKEVTSTNYFELKNRLAEQFLTEAENVLGIDILNCIEEMDIATPVTYARYTNAPIGAIGYQQIPNDDLVFRYMNYKKEKFIKGLEFCGASSFLLAGNSATYLSGSIIADEITNK